MPTIRPATIVTISTRVYHLLLRLCPAEYRAQYGAPMAQVFRALAREAYAQHGAWGITALWSRILPDTCVTALAEHWATFRQGDRAQLRILPALLVLLSLCAPWYRFSDGSSTFSGWLTLVASLLPTDWSLYHVLLAVMTASLAAALLVAFRVGPLAARLPCLQPLFLFAALACLVAYIWPCGPEILWGAWLTTSCISAALATEAALWVGVRGRLQAACAAPAPGAELPPMAGSVEEGEPTRRRAQAAGPRRRKVLLVPLVALALLIGAGLLSSAVLGLPLGGATAGGAGDRAYAEACRALTAAQEMPVQAWKETLLWRAIGKFGESLRGDPTNASAYCNRGNAYAVLGWYDQAVADYTAALAILPGSADITKNRGLAYERWGKPHEALADYEAFLGAIADAPGQRRAQERTVFADKMKALAETQEDLR